MNIYFCRWSINHFVVFCAKAKRQQQHVFCAKAKRQQQHVFCAKAERQQQQGVGH